MWKCLSVAVILIGSLLLSCAISACSLARPSTATPEPRPTMAPASITETAQARQDSKNTRTAEITMTAVAAPSPTATRYPRATDQGKPPTPQGVRSQPRETFDRNLIIDIENVGLVASALLPHLKTCIARGELDWDLHSAWFERYTEQMEDIALDSMDGYLDRYSKADVQRIVSSAFDRFDQLERQCLR